MIGRLRSILAVVRAYYAGRLAEHVSEMFEAQHDTRKQAA